MKQIIKLVAAAVVALSSLLLGGVPALAQTDDYYDYGDPSTTLDDYYTTSVQDDAAAAGALGFSMVVWVGICCFGLLIAGGFAYWVYSDAKKNNVENGVLWAVLTFFFGLIPLLIYFLAIKKNATGGSTPAAK